MKLEIIKQPLKIMKHYFSQSQLVISQIYQLKKIYNIY